MILPLTHNLTQRMSLLNLIFQQFQMKLMLLWFAHYVLENSEDMLLLQCDGMFVFTTTYV